MKKIGSFSLYLIVGSSLFAQQDTSIYYLNSVPRMEATICSEDGKVSQVLSNLKSYINDCYAEKANLIKSIEDWISDENISQEQLTSILQELVEGMRAIMAIPHAEAYLLAKKCDLQEIAKKFTDSFSKEILQQSFSSFMNEIDLPYLALLVDDSSLAILLEKIASTYTDDALVVEYIHLLKNFDFQMIDTLHLSLEESKKISLFESMLILFSQSKSIRHYLTSIFPVEDANMHVALAKKFIDSKKDDLLCILFGLLPPSQLTTLQQILKNEGFHYKVPLPGRMGSQGIYHASFEAGQIYFYMDTRKFHSICNLVESVEKDMVLSVDRASESKMQIVPEIIKHPIPIGYNDQKIPTYRDNREKDLLANYIREGSDTITRLLGYSITNSQAHLDLMLNQDPLIRSKSNEIDYELHEYVMVDWQMPEGTISGLIIEDGLLGDRFIMTLSPHEVCCLFILNQKHLNYTYFSPIDYQSTITPGSTKGKNMVMQLSGELVEDPFRKKKTNVIPIEVNTYCFVAGEKQYLNGLCLKQKAKDFRFNPDPLKWIGSQENVDIFEFDQKKHGNYASQVANHFGLKNVELSGIYRLVKRTAGLSQLNKMGINIPADSVIVMINQSLHPEGYDYFNLAEDQTDIGFPWIQLYRCPPEFWIKMNKSCFDRLALTPIEEFLFKNSLGEGGQENELKEKIVTEMDLFIFSSSRKLK